jgi:hypothetical protein
MEEQRNFARAEVSVARHDLAAARAAEQALQAEMAAMSEKVGLIFSLRIHLMILVFSIFCFLFVALEA